VRALVIAVGVVGALLTGCAHDGWMADESERISDPIERTRAQDAFGEDADPALEEELAGLRGPSSKKRTRRARRERWYIPRGCDDVAVRD
jgi:hypothetical protein